MESGTGTLPDRSRGTGDDGFDVSVIIPVFNTMPYLTACLESIRGQTMGLGRIQVVAVDDGSTDGGGHELDRFADLHPQSVVVRHQPNSGGPANPCNEGLALATGRYLFFLGADDYLAPDALQRLVTKADQWGSDIIFGTMVGVNDRYVDQRIYQTEEQELTFLTHPLAYSLSNTKLFRRALIEESGLRYPEDLKVGSDQLFVVQAVLKARRVSVLTGEPFYYAVKRENASNITYASSWRSRLTDVTKIMDRIAALVPDDEELRDSILRRHFHFELGNLLKRDFPDLPHDDQQELLRRYAELADRYLTERIAARLPVDQRAAVRIAHLGDHVTLAELARYDRDHPPQLVLRNGQGFSDLPGSETYPEGWYQHSPGVLQERLEANAEVTDLRLEGSSVLVSGKTRIRVESPGQMYVALVKVGPDHVSLPARRIESHRLKSRRIHPVTVHPGSSEAGALWDVRVALPVVPDMPREGLDWEARLRFEVDRWSYDLPIRLAVPSDRALARERLAWQSLRLETQPDGYVRIHQRLAVRLN